LESKAHLKEQNYEEVIHAMNIESMPLYYGMD